KIDSIIILVFGIKDAHIRGHCGRYDKLSQAFSSKDYINAYQRLGHGGVGESNGDRH
ncbi:hypothetical protein GOP47_0015717, partial [Adiantum capillus-veneris]